MQFGKNVVKEFLWESYNIDSQKYLIQKIKEASTFEREEVGKHETLRHVFLIKRMRDPGFRFFLLDKIKKDEHALKMTALYVQKMLLNDVYFDENRMFSPGSTDGSEKNQKKRTVDTNLKHETKLEIIFEDRGDGYLNIEFEKSPESFVESELTRKKNSLDYFIQRYEMALEEEDYLTADAVEHVIYEYKTGNASLEKLYEKGNYYWEKEDDTKTIYSLDKYFFENFRYAKSYVDINVFDKFYTEQELMGLILRLEFEENFVRLLERYEIPIERENIEDIESIKYHKFLFDVFSIASLVWFNSLELKQKEKILNDGYDLSEQMLKGILEKLIEKRSNRFLANILFYECIKNKFFDISYMIASHEYDNSKDPHDKLVYQDKLGEVCRERMNYEEALEHYKKAYEIAVKIPLIERSNNKKNTIDYKASRRYATTIALLRIAELEYLLGIHENAKGNISDIEKMSQELNIYEQLSILWNIACTYKRTKQYEKEYECLDKIAELGSGKRDDLVKKADKRLFYLNGCFTHDFTLDASKIEENEIKTKKEKILKNAHIMRNNFQFRREIEYLNDALKLENDPNLRLEIAVCYYNLKELDSARREIEEIISETDSPKILTFCHLYLAFIHFQKKNDEEGFSELEATVKYSILYKEKLPDDDKAAFVKEAIIGNCVFILLPLKRAELVKKVLLRILETFETSNIGREEYILLYYITSNTLQKCGLVNESLFFANMALEKISDHPKLRIIVLDQIANIYFNTGAYEQAIKYLKKETILDPTLAGPWYNMALVYAKMLNFKCAESCIEKALNIEPQNKQLKELKEKYNELNQNTITFRKIRDEDVKKYFVSAERVVLELSNSFDEKEFDFSMSLVSYGKGLESMLHNRVSKPLREKMHKKYGTPIEKGIEIPDDLWDGDKNKKIPRLPRTLKSILGINEATISLRSWKYIFEDCKSNSKNQIIKESRGYFAGKLNKNKETIFDACEIVAEYRNGAAHYRSKTKDEILAYRKEIIEKINNVINVLY